jgi:hypothetical protein
MLAIEFHHGAICALQTRRAQEVYGHTSGALPRLIGRLGGQAGVSQPGAPGRAGTGRSNTALPQLGAVPGVPGVCVRPPQGPAGVTMTAGNPGPILSTS